MTESPIPVSAGKTSHAFDELRAFVDERRAARGPVTDFEAFEREAQRRFAAAQAEFVAEELARLDIDAPAVEIDGVGHRRVLRCPQTYMTAAGPVTVERTLYSTRQDDERAVCAMELRAGIVEDYFTPLAALNAAWAVAHLTPGESEALFARMGGMNPSKSSLDRLPKALSARWEDDRVGFEKRLRDGEKVPKDAVVVAVSLDGVLVPMKDGRREEKRAATRARGQIAKGPAGYHEASCGTLCFYDRAGDLLATTRLGRMPESGKATLKAALTDELDAALTQRPALRVVGIADGVKDNWAFLSTLPGGRGDEQIVDFWHAAQHLNEALEAVYGEASLRCQAEFQKHRHTLRHDPDGIAKVIRHLAYLRDKHPRKRKLVAALGYFRRHRQRMRYARFARRKLPIGSGLIEAACKTLVTQRLKRSGMRWRTDGGQAILTLRALEQSGRFDRAWRMLAATYVHAIRLPDNVIDLASRRPRH
ncbi:MAG TPA: hypothetical protein VIJ96_12985 [Acidothermaceae bacterium]